MYKDNNQLRIEDFVFPYGTLDKENDWVKLAKIVPWETIEEGYAARFVNNGHPAHPARMAFGALAIKQRLKCSDDWVVKEQKTHKKSAAKGNRQAAPVHPARYPVYRRICPKRRQIDEKTERSYEFGDDRL